MARRWKSFGYIKDRKGRKEETLPLALDEDTSVSRDLHKNLQRIRQEIGNSPDVIIREYYIGHLPVQVAAVYAASLTDQDAVGRFITQSLKIENGQTTVSMENVFQFIKGNALTVQEIKVISDWNELLLSVLSGDTVLLIETFKKSLWRGGPE